MTQKNKYLEADIADKIRAARKKKGLSQAKLAKKIGRYGGNYISRIETGTYSPSIQDVVDIFGELDLSVSDILGQQDPTKEYLSGTVSFVGVQPSSEDDGVNCEVIVICKRSDVAKLKKNLVYQNVEIFRKEE